MRLAGSGSRIGMAAAQPCGQGDGHLAQRRVARADVGDDRRAGQAAVQGLADHEVAGRAGAGQLVEGAGEDEVRNLAGVDIAGRVDVRQGRVLQRGARHEITRERRAWRLHVGMAWAVRIDRQHRGPTAVRVAGVGQRVQACVVRMIGVRRAVGVDLHARGHIAVGCCASLAPEVHAVIAGPDVHDPSPSTRVGRLNHHCTTWASLDLASRSGIVAVGQGRAERDDRATPTGAGLIPI